MGIKESAIEVKNNEGGHGDYGNRNAQLEHN